MDFVIGREEESKQLLKFIKSNKAEFIAIYGRRRVGKTYLIRNLFEGQFAFDVSGIINGSKLAQLSAFSQALRQSGMSPDVPNPDNWMDAFAFLRELMEGQPKTKPCIMFVDELPCFDTPRAGFINALDHFWNGWAAHQRNVKLIVCGSATSWMMKNIIDSHGGLHNRLTHELHLSQFTLLETEQYLRHEHFKWNRKTICELYMVTGGIPYYLSLLDNSIGLHENIDRLFFRHDGELRREYQRLYRSLFKTPEPYMRIIQLLATHKNGLTRDEIKQYLGKETGGYLSVLLEDLVNCDFVRYFHVRHRKIQKSGGIYQLVDFYTLFFFTFCNVPTTDEHFWSHMALRPQHNTWNGLAFERVCMAHIQQIKQALGIDRIHSEYYSWRSRESKPAAQIDLLIDRSDQLINLCEVKFSNAPYTITEEEEMRLRIRVDDFLRETKAKEGIILTFITTYGLRQNNHSECVDAVITMNDLFG